MYWDCVSHSVLSLSHKPVHLLCLGRVQTSVAVTLLNGWQKIFALHLLYLPFTLKAFMMRIHKMLFNMYNEIYSHVKQCIEHPPTKVVHIQCLTSPLYETRPRNTRDLLSQIIIRLGCCRLLLAPSEHAFTILYLSVCNVNCKELNPHLSVPY